MGYTSRSLSILIVSAIPTSEIMVENYKKWFTVWAGFASLGEVASTADDLRPLPCFIWPCFSNSRGQLLPMSSYFPSSCCSRSCSSSRTEYRSSGTYTKWRTVRRLAVIFLIVFVSLCEQFIRLRIFCQLFIYGIIRN